MHSQVLLDFDTHAQKLECLRWIVKNLNKRTLHWSLSTRNMMVINLRNKEDALMLHLKYSAQIQSNEINPQIKHKSPELSVRNKLALSGLTSSAIGRIYKESMQWKAQ